jgi:hypothetical protein
MLQDFINLTVSKLMNSISDQVKHMEESFTAFTKDSTSNSTTTAILMVTPAD